MIQRHHNLLDEYGMFHPRVLRWIEQTPGTILLETTRHDRRNHRSYLFHHPLHSISCTELDDVRRCLGEIQAAISDGLFAAGYCSYEAGYAFEARLQSYRNLPAPLLWFGIYDDPIIYNHKTRRVERGVPDVIDGDEIHVMETRIHSLAPSMTESEYQEGFAIIKQHLNDGDTYQVNYTFKLKGELEGSAAVLYAQLRSQQRVAYAAFINTGNERILSLSPEMFFKRQGVFFTLKPMKGTAPRGRTNEEDAEHSAALRSSVKNKAENLMIVDLLRNDVGRIAAPGTVRVTRFFEIEKYETVLQATSTIQARLRPGIGVVEIVRALFPSGSVTGAPKLRTMQIIHELEKEPRGVYTGAIGFWAPRRSAMFNVAIRTVVVRADGKAEMGVGSGIVSDSEPGDEYRECLLKSKFLTEPAPDFKLIETIRWKKNSGWFMFDEHRERLKASARYFDFPFNDRALSGAARECEQMLARTYGRDDQVRVRLTLNRAGRIEWQHRPLEPRKSPEDVTIWPERTDSRNRFLFHKTTNRALYDQALEECRKSGYFDAIFLNERDEVTEGARSNVVALVNGELCTPPLECGLLAGTYRAHLLKEGKIEERILKLEDLTSSLQVYLCNSLYGLFPVRIVHHADRGK